MNWWSSDGQYRNMVTTKRAPASHAGCKVYPPAAEGVFRFSERWRVWEDRATGMDKPLFSRAIPMGTRCQHQRRNRGLLPLSRNYCDNTLHEVPAYNNGCAENIPDTRPSSGTTRLGKAPVALPYDCGGSGSSADFTRPHLAIRNVIAVERHPKPYLTLRRKLIEEASGA